MMFNPFGLLGAKIFAGVAAAAIAFGAVQTVRIEGAFCRDLKPGEKPACIVQGFKQEVAGIRIDLDAARERTAAEAAAHEASKRAYREAQAEAEKAEAARLARVTAQQKEANHDLVQDYERRIASVRVAASRLRGETGQARAGSAGARANGALPRLSDAAGGADGAASDIGLSLDQRLTATETAIRLEKLQEWNRRQAAIDPN